MSIAAAPQADAGGVAALGAALSQLLLWFVPSNLRKGYDQKYILTCQV